MPIRQGEVYFLDFGSIDGREPAKERPALVVSTNLINALAEREHTILLITVMPGTKGSNKLRDYPTDVRVPASHSGLPQETIFRAFQITSIDSRRFPQRPSGHVSDEYLAKAQAAIRFALGLFQ